MEESLPKTNRTGIVQIPVGLRSTGLLLSRIQEDSPHFRDIVVISSSTSANENVSPPSSFEAFNREPSLSSEPLKMLQSDLSKKGNSRKPGAIDTSFNFASQSYPGVISQRALQSQCTSPPPAVPPSPAYLKQSFSVSPPTSPQPSCSTAGLSPRTSSMTSLTAKSVEKMNKLKEEVKSEFKSSVSIPPSPRLPSSVKSLRDKFEQFSCQPQSTGSRKSYIVSPSSPRKLYPTRKLSPTEISTPVLLETTNPQLIEKSFPAHVPHQPSFHQSASCNSTTSSERKRDSVYSSDPDSPSSIPTHTPFQPARAESTIYTVRQPTSIHHTSCVSEAPRNVAGSSPAVGPSSLQSPVSLLPSENTVLQPLVKQSQFSATLPETVTDANDNEDFASQKFQLYARKRGSSSSSSLPDLAFLSASIADLQNLASEERQSLDSSRSDNQSIRSTSTASAFPDSWASRMSPAILSELSSEEIRRQEAINELVETEYSFSYDMQMVHDCFLEPMKSNGLLSEQEIDEVFSNWTEMMIVSKNLYSVLLARVNEEYPIVQFIGDVLLTQISRLKCFASFCGLAQYGVAKLKEKQKIDQNLWEFLHESRRIPHFAKLSIETFLLKPMQRVTKMPLLIKAILKHTPQHHPDYANIFAADRMITDVLNYINNRCGEIQTKRHNEQLMKSLDRDLAKDLGFSLFDYNNSRELIFFSDILYQSRKCTAVLFSDLLILASCNKLADKERYNLIKWFNLWCLEIKNIGNLETVSGSDSSRSSLSEGTVGRRVSRTFQNFMLDPDELARSIHFYDIPTDSLIEMRLQTSEEKRKFADRLSAAICFLHKASRFELFNLHSLNHYPFQTWKCATSFGGLVLLGSDQAMWYGREDSLQNQALPGRLSEFSSIKESVEQIEIVEHLDLCVTLQGRKYKIFLYNLSVLRRSLAEKSTMMNLKHSSQQLIQKLKKSKNTQFFATGRMFDEVDVLVSVGSKRFMLYQWKHNHRSFEKRQEFYVPRGNTCNSIVFRKTQILAALGNHFTIIDATSSIVQEIADPDIVLQKVLNLDESMALECFQLGKDEFLLCYREIGCVVNSAGRQIRQAFLRWQSPAKQVHYEKPYLYVYTLKAVEVWQVEDTQLVQLIPVPAMKVLNRHLKLLGVGVAVSTNSPLNMKATNETAWLGIVREKADK